MAAAPFTSSVRAAVPPPELLLPACAGDQPLLLLPVRLETRFLALDGARTELRIRVYPDKVHIDAHEATLLPQERDWAEHYWQQFWRAGHDAARERAAWRQLNERYGAARAAWLMRVKAPLNPEQQPTAPLADAAPLDPAPVFPEVTVEDDGQNSAWRHAATARLLPARWTAVALARGALLGHASGKDIVHPLAVGPAPQAALTPVDATEPALDAAMRWMIDFEAAEAAGMALRLPLDAAVAAAGIDALLVFGCSAATPQQGATQLAQLLDAHQATDGLEFLRPGVPTNNTAEMRSAHGAPDAAGEAARAALAAAAATAADADSNAHRLAAALGLAPAALAAGIAAAPGAALRHATDQRAMAVALWPAAWGYYLQSMAGLVGTGLTQERIAWAREHFAAHLHALGAFAALRCGAQPYGVLPVTLLDDWQPPAGAEAEHAPDLWLKGFLQKLRNNVWRPRIFNVPRIGRSADPERELADLMRSDALSTGYSARPLLGRHYTQHLRTFVGENLEASGFNSTHRAATIGVLQRLQLPPLRLTGAVYGDLPWKISGPLVQAGEVSPEQPLVPNYIGALRAATSLDALIQTNASGGAAGSLLHALLRHALLLAYAGAAAALVQSAGGDARAFLRDEELIDLVPGGLTPTWLRLLEQKLPAVTGDKTIRQFLESTTRFDTPALAPLGAVREALAQLEHASSETLLQAMQGTLDLSAHRLDAWIGSFAHKRLAALRAAAPQGLRVGGYGWVVDLKPHPDGASPVTPPAGESGPMVTQPDDSGFIHAPSMAHAAAAALLRNAHLGHDGVARADKPFAIDLSSRRLRDARWLLDGIRQGQPLGALLGYRFERRLHEMRALNLDRFIAPFRELAPLATGSELAPGTVPLEAIAAHNVVDGLVLSQRWKDTGPPLLASRADLPQPALGAAYDAVVRELDALAETLDALADALSAETAYQLVRGNVSRTAATLSAVAAGEAPAPELEVARTPRTGIGATHRVLLAFSGATARTPGWAGASTSPRAAAEPMLNAWAARLLGDPRKVICRIEELDAAGATLVKLHELKLSDLKLAPLDIVYATNAQAAPGQALNLPAAIDPQALGEIEQRLLLQLRSAVPELAEDARLRIVRGRAAGADAKLLTLDDVLGQAAAARALLAAARALDATDLELPEREAAPGLDLAELLVRAERADKVLLATHNALRALLKPTAQGSADQWRTALMRAAALGVAGALPVVARGDGDAIRGALRSQANAIVKETQSRLDRGAELRTAAAAAAAGATLSAQRDALFERLRAVFGAGFVVLPRFACANAEALGAALAASTAVQGGDALAVHTWFTRAERVRDALARFGSALRGAEVLRTGERLAFSVAQLPPGPAERWVALPPAPGTSIAAGRLALVVHAMQPLDPAQPLAGLLVDEWVEVVPNERETTAIAFQYNPPDAQAPQAWLLAVPPVPDRAWTLWDLHRLLLETLELAKLRAIDIETLFELGHYLPAMHFAFNVNHDAVATDFGPLTR